VRYRHHHGWRDRRRRHRHGFSFGTSWGRFFGPGEARLALLSLLSEGPKHGYELMKQLEDRSGGMYRASAGTVYPTLQQLEDEGHVTSEPAGGKRVYRVTPEGERELESEADAVLRIWRRAEEWGEWSCASLPEAWEIRRPAMQLVKAAMRAVVRAGDDPDRIDRVREILEDARRDLEAASNRLVGR
jgi:DNA-binding PadR family transcriptional regulator